MNCFLITPFISFFLLQRKQKYLNGDQSAETKNKPSQTSKQTKIFHTLELNQKHTTTKKKVFIKTIKPCIRTPRVYGYSHPIPLPSVTWQPVASLLMLEGAHFIYSIVSWWHNPAVSKQGGPSSPLTWGFRLGADKQMTGGLARNLSRSIRS